MKKITLVLFLLPFFFSACHHQKITTQVYNCDRIFPFGITSTTNGFYIYPRGEEIKKIKKAEFLFYKTHIWNGCFTGYPYIGRFKTAVTYTTSSKKKVLYVKAREGEIYVLEVRIIRRCKGHFYSYLTYSGVIGTQRVKYLPFEDFDEPMLHFSAFQSANNFFYYGGFDSFCKQLPKEVDKYIPVNDINDIVGCYTLSNKEGVYCESTTGVVKVYAGKVDKFYSLLWKENLYRIYILADDHFMVYDFSPIEGTINKIFEEGGIRGVYPGLSHMYNKRLVIGNKVFHRITYYGIYRAFGGNMMLLNRMKYFYLLKATDEAMVEILKPDLTKDYQWYWKPVSAVSYYFMDITFPIKDRVDYLPRGVVFKDGSVYLEDFRREYKFPFRIKKLWMVKYPGKIWDRYSGFMVGSNGYMVLVSDATHFDYVRFRDYNEIRDISWSSVIGRDGSFTSLMLLYSKDLKTGYEDMCKTHNLSCNILYFFSNGEILCDQLEFPTWGSISSSPVNLYPFLPSTRKWEVDCGTVQPEIIEIGR